MSDKFIWWKGIALGPFPEPIFQNLNWTSIEASVDEILKTDFPRTPPLSLDMEANPNIPHIFFKS